MKRITGLLLSMLLMLTLTAGVAFAEDAQPETQVASESTTHIAEESSSPAAEENASQAAEENASPAAEESTEEPADISAEEEMESEPEVVSEMTLEDLLGESEGISVEVPLSEEGELVMEDYSTIEVPSNQVNVQDFEIDTMIQNILSEYSTTETITEGTVEEGDVIVFDFKGVLDGETDPFEGGTAEGYSAQMGSGSFIPGFEDQIIGHEIGETFDIHVTFPEDYAPETAGKGATFTITVHNKSVTTEQELNDEFVQTFSSENLDEELNTVDELREYIRDYLYRNYLQNAIMSQLREKVTVISYPEQLFNTMKEFSMTSLTDYVSMYAMQGMGDYTEDMLAKISGYASAEDYTNDEARSYLDTIMMADQIAEDLGIEVSEEEYNDYMNVVLQQNGLADSYSIEDLPEVFGEGWVTINRYNLLLSKELEALEERAVIVQSAMTYYEFMTAQVDDEVMVDMYVQDTQKYEDGHISVYGADTNGGYFVYNMECTEEDAAKLVPGTKIRVTGYKAEWSGEVEIADATFTFAEDTEDTYIAEPVDVTEMLGTSALTNYMNQFVSFTGMTVEPSLDADGNEFSFLYNWDGSGTQGDDIYFNVSYNGSTYTFLVESNLCGQDTEVYQAAEALNVGDVIDMQGFLYWYEGANPHITSITVE